MCLIRFEVMDWRARGSEWTMGTCAMLALLLMLSQQPQAHASVLAHPNASQLEEVASLIEKRYVRELPHDSLTVAARRCFEGTLDRYTTYLDSAATFEFEQTIAGRIGGIGVALTSDTTGVFRIASVNLNSPALRAGLREGDTLVTVDGLAIRGRDFFEVLGRVRGTVGSRIHLVVRRGGTPAELDFTIRRVVIELLTVRPLRIAASDTERYLVDEQSRIAYVRIENFSKRTPDQLDQALAAVRRVGARALVLDLRDDGGGALGSAIAAADRFLESGTILTMKKRGRPDQVMRAHAGVECQLPLAVLINANTASAAEILAASLQDNGRARVLGCRSFGKGVSLDLIRLKRTPGLLKLTTSVSLRPSGVPLERHIPGMDSERGGVWPDSGLTVTLSREEEEHWSEKAFQTTLRMQVVGAAPDSTPALPDRVLERAVEVLRAAKAH
jgi:carboxyl-terminal processing protease